MQMQHKIYTFTTACSLRIFTCNDLSITNSFYFMRMINLNVLKGNVPSIIYNIKFEHSNFLDMFFKNVASSESVEKLSIS